MGELSLMNIGSFQDSFYSADFYLDATDDSYSQSKIKRDFLDAASKTGVDFFTIKFLWKETYEYETVVIGTDGAIAYLKDCGLNDGYNKSLFFDSEKLTYERFKYAKDISDCVMFYFIGDSEKFDDIKNFKAMLIDSYGGGYPHEKGNHFEATMLAAVVWSIIFTVTLLISAYEIMLKRKEYMLKVILGQDLVMICLRNIILDVVSFTTIFFTCSFLLEGVSSVRYQFRWVFTGFAVFLVINTLIDLGIFRLDYKRDLSGAKDDGHILSINYMIKQILSVVTIIALALNCTVIGTAFNVHAIKAFFAEHSDYCYYRFDPENEPDDVEEMFQQFDRLYEEFDERFQKNALWYGDRSGYYDLEHPFVLLNKNAIIEQQEYYPELNNTWNSIPDNGQSILLPEDAGPGTNDYEKLEEAGLIDQKELNLLVYSGDIQIPAIHYDSYTYNINNYKNPIIMVLTNNIGHIDGLNGYDTYNSYDFMYDIGEKDWADFFNSHNINKDRIAITSVFDEYEHLWSQQRRKLALTIALSGFLILLEIALISSVIRMEYNINSIELALKKVHGYSLFERNKRLLISTIISGIIGTLVAFVLSALLDLNVSRLEIILCSGVLVAAEIIVILIKSALVEKQSLTLILKGEMI